MPLITNTVANFLALFDDIRSAAVANGWVEEEYVTDTHTILKSTLDDDRIIRVGCKTVRNSITDRYGLIHQGYIGYLNGTAFELQPGSIPSYMPYTPLYNNTMTYWFVVKPRVIRGVVKVSTVYMAFYLGLLNQFGSNGEYPYPLVIGGSGSTYLQDGTNYTRYSDTTDETHHFATAHGPASFPVPNRSSLCIRDPSGTWRKLRSNEALNTYTGSGIYPYCQQFHETFQGYNNVKPTIDGKYPLTRLEVIDPNKQRYGELDGCFHVSGFGQTAESIITIGSDEYLVVPDVYRTGTQYWWAFKLGD